MVAYSFAPQFIEPVSTGRKLQTVRSPRKRHARAGEALQLFTAMRTKYCRKLLTPDPICSGVRSIIIDVESAAHFAITSIAIDGVHLSDDEIEEFAVADGFGSELCDGFARQRMGLFWLKHHGAGLFDGVLISWGPIDSQRAGQ